MLTGFFSIFLTLICFLLPFFFKNEFEKRWVKTIFFISALFHVLYITYGLKNPNNTYFFFDDAKSFYLNSLESFVNPNLNWIYGNNSYHLILSSLYHLNLRESWYLACIFSSFCHLLSFVFFVKIMCLSQAEKIIIPFSLLFLLSPTLIAINSSSLREGIMILLISIYFFSFLKIKEEKFYVLPLIVSYILGSFLHIGLFISLTIFNIFLLIFLFNRRRVACFVLLIATLFNILHGIEGYNLKNSKLFAKSTNTNTNNFQKEKNFTNNVAKKVLDLRLKYWNSGADKNARANYYVENKSYHHVILAVIKMFIDYFYKPFYSDLSKRVDLVAYAEKILRSILIIPIFMAVGMRNFFPILVIWASINSCFAVFTFNYGTSLRHLALTYPFLLILGLYGFNNFFEYIKNKSIKNNEKI